MKGMDYCFVHSWHEYSQDEHCADRWRQVTRHTLNIIKQLTVRRCFDQRNPQDTDTHQHYHEHSNKEWKNEWKNVWRFCVNLLSDYRPTTMSSPSEAPFRMSFQMSMVNMVLALLKMDDRDDMRADNMHDSIRPRRPSGNNCTTSNA